MSNRNQAMPLNNYFISHYLYTLSFVTIYKQNVNVGLCKIPHLTNHNLSSDYRRNLTPEDKNNKPER